MSTHRSPISAFIGSVCVSVVLGSVANAAPMFDDNNIGFDGIPNTANYTITVNNQTLTKLANGFTVRYDYTLTTSNADAVPVNTTWSADRAFTLPTAQNLVVRINGETRLTMPANSTLNDLTVNGGIVPGRSVMFESQAYEGAQNATPITWDESSEAQIYAARGYRLEEFSGPGWTPPAVAGARLIFASQYTVTVVPPELPELSTWAMTFAGFAGLGVAGRSFARRRAAPAA